MSVNRDVAAIVMGLREVPGRDIFYLDICFSMYSQMLSFLSKAKTLTPKAFNLFSLKQSVIETPHRSHRP
ncbi:Uncharacterized protein TCM_014013 [Theobroma cacao]|uniref:Uncharacterized protein n=1 Tax=Theobroma cacao TaxID=3641 RepID=A0A061G499_THECC|nr:Uncharacterized protein TCM_014013 [Theobroma cacao]